MGKSTKIFFATDIHGSETCWMKFVNAGKFYNADVLIAGGDLVGKGLVLLVESPKGTWRCDYRQGQPMEASGEGELLALEKKIRAAGFYPHRTDPEGQTRLAADKSVWEAVLAEEARKTITKWLDIAAERVEGTARRVFYNAGNDDPFWVDEVMAAHPLGGHGEGRVLRIDDDHEMISCGWANRTPWNTERECDEADLEAKIEAAAAQITDMERAIFNLHVPPYDTGLDTASQLDKDLRPIDAGQRLIPVGSTAVKNSIKRHQPLLALHGHIHESRAQAKIGRTVCVNPGSQYGQSILAGALITIERDKVREVQTLAG